MASSSNSKVLNLGSFGVVLHPALQNEPPYENDPHSYITKVFYKKEAYDDIRKKKKRLSTILGVNEEGYQFQTYEREWKGKNLPNNAYRLLSEQLNNTENTIEKTNRRNQRFYPIRMLHLGKSIVAVKVLPELTQQFRQCEIKHVIASFKKLVDTVTKLSTHHTLHGDIHPHNIVIYMAGSFCDMSLLDYDLFESYEEMKHAYHVEGRDYIYGPPEVYHMVLPHKRDTSDEKGQEEDIITHYVARIRGSEHFNRSYPSQAVLQQQVRKAIDQHGTKPIPYHHMDSFMLCAVLLDLMYTMYPFLYNKDSTNESWSEQEQDALRRMKMILESGVTLSSTRRSGPKEIQKELQRLLCKVKGLPSPPSTPPSSSHTKTNKNKNKGKKNNGCVLSGGIYAKKNLQKTRKRKGRM